MEGLTEVESKVIVVDDIDEEEKEACLVGMLVMEMNWNPSDLIEAITKAWKLKHDMSSRECGESKLILFRFEDAIERDWVLKHQPWLFKGSLFAINKFTGWNEQQLLSLYKTIDHASFWARLYDVPFSCMNERSLRLFAKQIGTLELVDKSDVDLIGMFIRFKVSVNFKKPLVRGITIRVKEKHLWLPLKYESLPIYCFCCGTIGHDHNNCTQSYNRNFEYSTLKLKEIEEQKDDTPSTLPHDIIENILSRLPVKYLLRFKAVSKQWNATISDTRFGEIHLQQYKNSSSRNLLAREEKCDYDGFHVSEFQENYFKFVSVIEHSWKCSLKTGILCNCDGLYLKYYVALDKEKTYVLWNPSCRAYKEFRCPQSINDGYRRETLYGICYNPLVKDYKVVIGDMQHYAVFSCKHNKWSEVKEMKLDATCNAGWLYDGVSLNGSFYWLRSVRIQVNFELICFDWRDESFKRLSMPDHGEKVECINLSSCGSHLYLFYSFVHEFSFWKRVEGNEGYSWVEFKVQLETSFFCLRPTDLLFWVNEDEIVVNVNMFRDHFMLYNLRKNTFVDIRMPRSVKLVPYLENLFLQ